MDNLKIGVFICCCYLLSCQSGSAENDLPTHEIEPTQSDDTLSGIITDSDTTVKPGTYKSFDAELADIMHKYFKPELVRELDDHLLEFNEVKTDKDFEASFDSGISIGKAMANSLNNAETEYLQKEKSKSEYYDPVGAMPDNEKAAMDKAISPIFISCAVECSEVDLAYNFEGLQELADATTGEMDDEFIEIAQSIDKYSFGFLYKGMGSWIEQTWDLGGASRLGNGEMINLIEKISGFEAKYDGFEKHIADYRKRMLEGLLYTGSFWLSKEEVIDEYRQIMQMDFFSTEQLKQIEETLEKLQNPPDYWQFDCQTGDCQFG
ncbi:MAG: hypothetical protein WDZ35_02780 [Crocinitomicaceae bacterium]